MLSGKNVLIGLIGGMGITGIYYYLKKNNLLFFKRKTAKTIFDSVGGKNTISKAVELFYGKVLEDDELRIYFKGIDMESV